MSAQAKAELIAIWSLPKEKRVRCMHDGCTKTIHASVYGVKEQGQYFAFGDTCYVKRFGSADALGPPKINPSGAKKAQPLTPEQLETLDRNLDDLLMQLEDEWNRQQEAIRLKIAKIAREHEQMIVRETARSKAIDPGHLDPKERLRLLREEYQGRQQPLAPTPNYTSYKLSPEWFKEVNNAKLIFCYLLKDRSQWVMYAALDGRLTLRPWPGTFAGWQYKLQPSMGTADLEHGCYHLAKHTAGLDVSRFTSCGHPVEIANTFAQLAKS